MTPPAILAHFPMLVSGLQGHQVGDLPQYLTVHHYLPIFSTRSSNYRLWNQVPHLSAYIGWPATAFLYHGALTCEWHADPSQTLQSTYIFLFPPPKCM